MAHVWGVLSPTASTGVLSGWNMVSNDPDDAFKRAESLGATGNETGSVLHDEIIAGSTTYMCATSSVPTVPATLGAVVNSCCLTGISLSTSADGFAQMTLTWHQHVSPGTHGTVRTVAHGITLDRAFGCSGFGLAPTETNGLFSSTCNIECQHSDALGTLGHTIAGENYDGKITIDVTATGAMPASLSGYDLVSTKTPQSNTDFLKQSVTFVKALAMA